MNESDDNCAKCDKQCKTVNCSFCEKDHCFGGVYYRREKFCMDKHILYCKDCDSNFTDKESAENFQKIFCCENSVENFTLEHTNNHKIKLKEVSWSCYVNQVLPYWSIIIELKNENNKLRNEHDILKNENTILNTILEELELRPPPEGGQLYLEAETNFKNKLS